MGLLMVSSGLRLNSTSTLTFLPIMFLGTRHEYEQVPPHPYSRLPLPTFLPVESSTVNVGFGGSALNFSPLA